MNIEFLMIDQGAEMKKILFLSQISHISLYKTTTIYDYKLLLYYSNKIIKYYH